MVGPWQAIYGKTRWPVHSSYFPWENYRMANDAQKFSPHNFENAFPENKEGAKLRETP
jgi:hypothetical protein